jgi:Tfp pilus assembly protein PilN
MMIQFNLLPDIKIQYLKARRQKHLVLLGSVVVIIASVAVLAILISVVFGVQKKSISDLSSDIDTASAQLEATRDLDKMLTVQNQLKSLAALHDAKPVASRLFGYITQATPTAASISKLNTDFALKTMSISGSADTLQTVNTFADTLKFTTYHTATQADSEKQAFTNVVLSSFGRDSKGATYTITLAFDPIIFSELEDVTLTVPNKVTTRSTTEQPSALFKQSETGQ